MTATHVTIGSVTVTTDMYARLSASEKCVVRLVVLGWTVKQIAEHMGLSMKTVSTFRTRAAKKLGTDDRRIWVQFLLQPPLFFGE